MMDNALCKYTGIKYNGEHKGQQNKVSLYENFTNNFEERVSLMNILKVKLKLDYKENILERGSLMKYSPDRESFPEELEAI